MIIITHWFLLSAVLVASISLVSILPRGELELRYKFLSLFLTAIFLLCSYSAMRDMLSRPKPIGLGQFAGDSAEVISYVLKENEAIYIWLNLASENEPRAYQLPWTEDKARELHEANQEAQTKGTALQMSEPIEDEGGDVEPIFHAAPPTEPEVKG